MAQGRSNKVWLAVFLGAAVLVAAVRWRVPLRSGGLTATGDRKPMADVVLPALNGGAWRLADHAGQVVLLNYWATWCEPCRDELPVLIVADREWGSKGLVVVGVSFDAGPDAQAKVRDYVGRYRVPYAIAFPDARLNAEAIDIGLPTTVLIDRHGRRAKTYYGEVNRRVLARDVAALLAEK